MRYRVKAYANLRHYLPAKEEDVDLDCDSPLTVGQIVDRLGIPRCEIMLVNVDGRVAAQDHLATDGATIELFPILAGG